MTEAVSNLPVQGSIAVLFHPSTVPVIDVFRSLGRLEDQYDLALLDGPEEVLATYTRPEAAKSIVSDALLLAFALTRQRGRPFIHRPLRSRHGSIDEYCLMALIGSSSHPASEVALEAAAYLDISSLDFMSALAGELIHQIGLGFLAFETPSLPEFRAIVGFHGLNEVVVDAFPGRADLNFRVQE